MKPSRQTLRLYILAKRAEENIGYCSLQIMCRVAVVQVACPCGFDPSLSTYFSFDLWLQRQSLYIYLFF